MPEQLPQVFQAVAAQAEQFAVQWQELNTRITAMWTAAVAPLPDDQELQKLRQRRVARQEELSGRLAAVMQHFLDSLWRPCLTLATAGTTSSGKSALVNLLCGAEILPVAVQEMSAGVVDILHGPARTLTIDKTPGAVWECGTWTGLADTAIRDRLRSVMCAYHEQRKALTAGRCAGPEGVACPQVKLEYPTRLGNDPALLGLPTCCQLRLLDLPGLKYVGDEGNRQVIAAAVREALCLVTYNAEETDSVKQEELLEQVAGQVKELGGSPARMLFVLNRIDAFRRNPDWPDAERQFVDDMTARIRQTLAKRLPEHAHLCDALRVLKLSTQPALLAHRMQTCELPLRREAAQALFDFYNFLIPRALYTQEMPRWPDTWEAHDCRRVGAAVWQTAYADSFFAALRDHVQRHLPDLVIPQAVDRFRKEAAQDAADWVVQTARAALHSSEERYKDERSRLQALWKRLPDLCQVQGARLAHAVDLLQTKLRKSVHDANLMFRELRSSLGELAQELGTDEAGLQPMYRWLEELARQRERTISALTSALEGRVDATACFSSLPPELATRWHMALGQVREAGYNTEHARIGKVENTCNGEEKQRLHKLNAALNSLAEVGSAVLHAVMDRETRWQQQRMATAIQQVLQQVWAVLTAQAKQSVTDSGLAESFLPAPWVPDLDLETKPLNLEYRFAAKLEVRQEVRREATGETVRCWYTLFLLRHRVVEDRTYLTADIPKAELLLENWDQHAKDQDPHLVQQMVTWMGAQLAGLIQAWQRAQDRLVREYTARLEEAHAIGDRMHAQAQGEWSGILAESWTLREELEQLGRPLAPAGGAA